jgi:hypothetical protein
MNDKDYTLDELQQSPQLIYKITESYGPEEILKLLIEAVVDLQSQKKERIDNE